MAVNRVGPLAPNSDSCLILKCYEYQMLVMASRSNDNRTSRR